MRLKHLAPLVSSESSVQPSPTAPPHRLPTPLSPWVLELQSRANPQHTYPTKKPPRRHPSLILINNIRGREAHRSWHLLGSGLPLSRWLIRGNNQRRVAVRARELFWQDLSATLSTLWHLYHAPIKMASDCRFQLHERMSNGCRSRHKGGGGWGCLFHLNMLLQ